MHQKCPLEMQMDEICVFSGDPDAGVQRLIIWTLTERVAVFGCPDVPSSEESIAHG